MKATLKVTFSVSIVSQDLQNGKGAEQPDDPRDEVVTPQAQTVEELEHITLTEDHPDRQVRIATCLSNTPLA